MMRMVRATGTVVLLLLLAAGAWAGPGCQNAACHDSMAAPYRHAPVQDGECEACHLVSSSGHPDEGEVALAEEGAALCLQCHEDPRSGQAHVHTPVAEGDCVACHDPHGGQRRYFLPASGGKLCLECHGEVAEAPKVHGPVKAAQCRYCHEAHASSEEAQLVYPGNKVCFFCHGGIEKTVKESVSQHSPVAYGRCWDCHRPHGSSANYLLKNDYPKEFYINFSLAPMAICFDCHDQNAFLYKRTSEATGFRNGDFNLHALHVNKPSKGRVCKTCHGVHGAEQDKLVLRRIPGFGNWDIPINFTSTDTGGTCLVGCHKPKSYNRFRTIANP